MMHSGKVLKEKTCYRASLPCPALWTYTPRCGHHAVKPRVNTGEDGTPTPKTSCPSSPSCYSSLVRGTGQDGTQPRKGEGTGGASCTGKEKRKRRENRVITHAALAQQYMLVGGHHLATQMPTRRTSLPALLASRRTEYLSAASPTCGMALRRKGAPSSPLHSPSPTRCTAGRASGHRSGSACAPTRSRRGREGGGRAGGRGECRRRGGAAGKQKEMNLR